MIAHLRIDNRLIHGQVAAVWKKHIGAETIIVCNDEVAQDEVQRQAMELAGRGSKVLVLGVEDTKKYARENPAEPIFVIAKLPLDALAIIADTEVQSLNVGNAAPVEGSDYVMVTKSIAATKVDAGVYRSIAEKNGGKLTSQIMPTLEEIDFLEAMEKAGL